MKSIIKQGKYEVNSDTTYETLLKIWKANEKFRKKVADYYEEQILDYNGEMLEAIKWDKMTPALMYEIELPCKVNLRVPQANRELFLYALENLVEEYYVIEHMWDEVEEALNTWGKLSNMDIRDKGYSDLSDSLDYQIVDILDAIADDIKRDLDYSEEDLTEWFLNNCYWIMDGMYWYDDDYVLYEDTDEDIVECYA